MGTHGVSTGYSGSRNPPASTAACRHTLHCASGQGFGDAALAAASMCRAYGAAAAEDSEVRSGSAQQTAGRAVRSHARGLSSLRTRGVRQRTLWPLQLAAHNRQWQLRPEGRDAVRG